MRFVLSKLVEARLSLRPAPHACGMADTQPGRSFDTRRSATEKQAGRFTSRRFPPTRTVSTLGELRLLQPHSVSRVRHPTVGGVRLSSTPSHVTCATDAGVGQQRKGGVHARQAHPGNGFKGQGGLGRRRRLHTAAQAADDCGGGRAAAGGAAGDRRRRTGLPERGRPRFRRAAAHAVRQVQWQAADGTGAAGTTATGDEGATGAADGTSNTTRRRTR